MNSSRRPSPTSRPLRANTAPFRSPTIPILPLGLITEASSYPIPSRIQLHHRRRDPMIRITLPSRHRHCNVSRSSSSPSCVSCSLSCKICLQNRRMYAQTEPLRTPTKTMSGSAKRLSTLYRHLLLMVNGRVEGRVNNDGLIIVDDR